MAFLSLLISMSDSHLEYVTLMLFNAAVTPAGCVCNRLLLCVYEFGFRRNSPLTHHAAWILELVQPTHITHQHTQQKQH